MMSVGASVPFVSTQWLKEALTTNKNIRVVDGTWHSPAAVCKRDAEAEYISGHIEGALRFNIDEIADKSAPLPRTVPPADQFGQQVGKLGISNSSHIIVYDNNEKLGMFSAARVWYMFRLYGHDNVSILEGGLPKWKADGGEVVSGPQPEVQPAVFKSKYCPELIRTFEQTLEAYNGKKEKIVDARPPGQFNGKDPEPNPKIPSGHIIGAQNLCWRNFFTPENIFIQSKDELEKLFAGAGINLDEPYISSCGGGISGCWITLAAFMCGKNVPLFDGSWPEWQSSAPENTKTPGVKGED